LGVTSGRIVLTHAELKTKKIFFEKKKKIPHQFLAKSLPETKARPSFETNNFFNFFGLIYMYQVLISGAMRVSEVIKRHSEIMQISTNTTTKLLCIYFTHI
jgi:hypothetical protein